MMTKMMTTTHAPRKRTFMSFAHFRSALCFSALLTLAFASACEEAPVQEAPAPNVAEPATHAHAAPGAAPGSHGDWCGAHAVPESLCTRCNPSLIAAFQATGDWCPEHNLPESQCLICNPELVIERPPLEAEDSP